MPQPPMYFWNTDSQRICAAVRQSRSTLKILLKTKNENFFIQRWINYYLNIIEEHDKLIILDNMSDDPEVLQTYRNYGDRLVVIRFDGHFNTVHSSLGRFQALYEAVWASSRYYALLDTDEYLCLYDGYKIHRDTRIVSCLERLPQVDFFPTLFLNNIYARDDAFFFEKSGFNAYHLTGKPLLNAAVMRRKLTVPTGHNGDMPLGLCTNAPLGFILLHLTQLSREQRIKTNMQKLENYGILAKATDFHSVLHMDTASIPLPHLRAQVEEVRTLLALDDPDAAQAYTTGLLQRAHIVLMDDGTVQYAPESLRECFKRHNSMKTGLLDILGLDSACCDPEQRLKECALAQGVA